MEKTNGKAVTTMVIIVLLVAILLAVTNPDRNRHMQSITDRLSGEDTMSNVLKLGLLTVNPPVYTSYALFSSTEYKDRTASLGIMGYVWINEKAFR